MPVGNRRYKQGRKTFKSMNNNRKRVTGNQFQNNLSANGFKNRLQYRPTMINPENGLFKSKIKNQVKASGGYTEFDTIKARRNYVKRILNSGNINIEVRRK